MINNHHMINMEERQNFEIVWLLSTLDSKATQR